MSLVVFRLMPVPDLSLTATSQTIGEALGSWAPSQLTLRPSNRPGFEPVLRDNLRRATTRRDVSMCRRDDRTGGSRALERPCGNPEMIPRRADLAIRCDGARS